jgi:hypothetical protein
MPGFDGREGLAKVGATQTASDDVQLAYSLNVAFERFYLTLDGIQLFHDGACIAWRVRRQRLGGGE